MFAMRLGVVISKAGSRRPMQNLESLPMHDAVFIEPMECLAVAKLPDGPAWIYEIKLDGYRALAINSEGKLSLVSRKRKSFNRQYPYILAALSDLPENTVVDGEIVALDDAGRPNFNLLQHSRSQASRICYFVFDLLIYESRDLTRLTPGHLGRIADAIHSYEQLISVGNVTAQSQVDYARKRLSELRSDAQH